MTCQIEFFDEFLNRFTIDPKFVENKEKIISMIEEKYYEFHWVENFICGTLKHKYLSRNFKKLYLNMSWDERELTLNFNDYKTREWKAFFTIDELKKLESKYKISNDFILKPDTVWDCYDKDGNFMFSRY